LRFGFGATASLAARRLSTGENATMAWNTIIAIVVVALVAREAFRFHRRVCPGIVGSKQTYFQPGLSLVAYYFI
jgi:hypothetical protein